MNDILNHIFSLFHYTWDMIVNNINKIDWLNDTVSTVLAVGVSWAFYKKTNKDAFLIDVLKPIRESALSTDYDKPIKQCIINGKSLYVYKYGSHKYKKLISSLEESIDMRKDLFESFSNSIWNYFFEIIEEDRFYYNSNNELAGCNYSEFDIGEYACSLSAEEDGFYEQDNDNLKQNLSSFYKLQIQGTKPIDDLLDGFDMRAIFHSSKEYADYQKGEDDYKKALNAIRNVKI